MNRKRIGMAVLATMAAGSMLITPAFAQVGEQLSKDISNNIHLDEEFLNGIHPEAEHVFVKYLRTYVPAQTASGDPAEPIEYNDIDGNILKTRDGAKPLISALLYGPVVHPEPVGEENTGGFVGHGKRDVYTAVSLDDGNTWKTSNLSESASESSITVNGQDYPGEAVNVVHAVAGNDIVVAWPSRYCRTGSPAYALSDTSTPTQSSLASYLGIDPASDLYLTDVFGVAGSQGSIDYAELGYPSVGEVPFNCLWAARGVLVEGDDPRTSPAEEAYHVVWYKPERLTSGRRDVNRVEVAMLANAGAVITWQEDPDGLLPGQGEGPGEGWSGAIGNSQTDIWYSFLPAEHFETVADVDGNPQTLADYWTEGATKPQPYVPFAVPVRLTNNARCSGGAGTPPLYCTEAALDYGLKNQCADTVTIPTGRNNTPTPICVSEDGLPNLANTAATRARVSLQPKFDADGNTVGGWVVIVAEESKGLGRYYFKVGETGETTATPCLEGDEDCDIADIGKNVWYFSFDMGSPQTSSDLSETCLVQNLVSQGNLLNQPETDWRTGEFYLPMDTADMWDFGEDYNFPILRTEIARRGSLMVQPSYDVAPSNRGQGRGNAGGNSGHNSLLAMPLFKQGLMQQGGPADIMGRRIINAGASANPYDFANMVCGERLYTDGSNPYYPKGVCLEPATNLSGTTLKECATTDGGTGDLSDGICPSISEEGIASDDPEDRQLFDKVETWIQCPGSPECGTIELSTVLGSNLDDQSWFNPLDVAKGHRGYLWRDMVVVMYAWSPSWKDNRVGHDRYELYIRRSFDRGKTWTTTPASWGGTGTTTCEFMRNGETASDAEQVCTNYAAGDPEQARNVSQLQSADGTPTNRFTVLDPRYAPDPPTMSTIESDYYDPDSDEFNPSRFFVVYETGDNETTAEGEAEALDLFYGRAVAFGDHYQVWAPEDGIETTCLPGANTDAGVFCNEFDRLTTGSDVSAEEASLVMSPAGDTLYSVWAQFSGEPVPDEPLSEARYARVWYTDPYPAWTAPPAAPGRPEPVMGD